MIHKLASSRLVKALSAFVVWFEHAGVVAINIEWLAKGSMITVILITLFLLLFSFKEAS